MNLLLYLSIGTLAMLIPIMIQGNWYQIPWGRRIAAAVLLTCAGTIGTFLMYYIENGRIGGTSFFGAVLFVPVLMIPAWKMLKLPYDRLLDLCASGECAMLVVMKVQCLLAGCCGGREMVMFGSVCTFPSQLLELLNALILCVLLLHLSREESGRGTLYPRYMVFYGICRFVLNIGRESWVTRTMLLPYGNIWSLVSVAVGLLWLMAIKKKNENSVNRHD